MSASTVAVVKAKFCTVPGPAVEVVGDATVIVRWKCAGCKLWHEARV